MWYFEFEDTPYGPYTLDQMKELVAKGKVLPETLVKDDEDNIWVPASSVSPLAVPRESKRMRKCPDCSRSVSYGAEKCPNCGADLRSTLFYVLRIIIVLAGTLLAVLFFWALVSYLGI